MFYSVRGWSEKMADFTIKLSVTLALAILLIGRVRSNEGTPYSITRNVSQFESYNAEMIETGKGILQM